MLEQEYLELVNQLKESFDKKEKEVEIIKENYFALFKSLISVYGVIRIIDDANEEDKPVLIEIIREYLSSIISPIINLSLNSNE
tara:strand:- start:1196 stop:1447 length:252 start_codon:yes stop_codon:yes gene_type:complete